MSVSLISTRLEATPTTFVDLFNRLWVQGQFRLSRMKEGCAHATIDLPTPDGVTVTVRSDFDHPNAMSAMICLETRLDDLKRSLGVQL